MESLGKMLVGAVAVVALYFVVTPVATAAFLNYLLTPGNVDWSGANRPAPTDPLMLNYRGDPRTAFGYDYSEVKYLTALGDANAWLVPAAQPNATWALYVHGVGGIRENGYKQLGILHEAGVPVLMITYRNDRGAPAGEPPLYSFGIAEWSDVDAAVTYALAQGASRIVLVAESMGGGIAGQFLKHSTQADKVVALALDAPALDFRMVAHHAAGGLQLPFAPLIADAGVGLFGLVRGIDMSSAEIMQPVIDFAGPVFLAHGTADLLVPVATSDLLAAERAAPTYYFRSTAQHLGSFNENPAEYRRGMLDMLRAAEIGGLGV